jgi:hypothetical protein
MDGIVPLLSKPLHKTNTHAHVCEKPHVTSAYEMWTSSWASQAAYSIAC